MKCSKTYADMHAYESQVQGHTVPENFTFVSIALRLGQTLEVPERSAFLCDCVAMAVSEQSHPIIPRVDVVFLAYRCADITGKMQPKVTLDSVCTISLFELEQHLRMKRRERSTMSIEAYKHYRWYNAALVAELCAIKGGKKERPLLRVFHWYIETSNRNAFRIEGKQYEAVSLVMAAEIEHWYCSAGAGKTAQGKRARVSDTPMQTESGQSAMESSASLSASMKAKPINSGHKMFVLENITEESG
ncbi:uncharacterized protein LOC126574288 [Anopheles aquasalis]|uniref:uncharacterized protein LOC126574288 n=1 Tax=Anopheles aquasalis TaxID=42839 RepID=UPI00215AED81|nr:uncharacterized protein LOC126574288 [Anopheles aquasalis]